MLCFEKKKHLQLKREDCCKKACVDINKQVIYDMKIKCKYVKVRVPDVSILARPL